MSDNELVFQSDDDNNVIALGNQLYEEDQQIQQQYNQTIAYTNHALATNDRFQTLQDTQPETKNIPKMIGNNFKKFIEKQNLQPSQFPQQMQEFLKRKEIGKQSSYTLRDFQIMLQNKVCRIWFKFYLKNCSYLDFLHSNRVKNTEELITFIEFYLSQADTPENFTSNRAQYKSKKNKKKIVEKQVNNVTVENIEEEQSEFQNDQINQSDFIEDIREDESQNYFNNIHHKKQKIQDWNE